MQKLCVNFNYGVGDVVFIKQSTPALVEGQDLAVYDLDTETYAAVVVESSATTATVQVDFTKVLETT